MWSQIVDAGKRLLQLIKNNYGLWKKADYVGKIWGIGVTFAPVFAIASFTCGHLLPEWAKQAIIAAWTVGVPMWFLFEWQTQEHKLTDEQVERFKYTQGLAAKVWLAVLGLLLFSYFPERSSELFKAHTPTPTEQAK
jgi:hypothetical protein